MEPLLYPLSYGTNLGEQLDSEALPEVITRYFEEIRGALEEHGGRVEKYIGDAVMAVFGLPRIREDDALRAVRAAAEDPRLPGGSSSPRRPARRASRSASTSSASAEPCSCSRSCPRPASRSSRPCCRSRSRDRSCPGSTRPAGLALALSAVALYGGLALGLEDARHQEVLPLFRRGAADAAFQGFDAQLGRPEAEPGVRQQL